MKKYHSIISYLILGLIFLTFTFLRFYNLEKRVGFNWDQEQFSYQIKRILVDHKLTLLGPRVNNDRGFFLAPYFIYLLVPFYFLTNLHPKALIYFVAFFNILFFWGGFFIIKKIFDHKIAFFFFMFWAINPLLIDYDTIAWNPIAIPLGIIVFWYILYKTYKSKSKTDYFILGLIIGFFNNMHFQFIFIFFFSLFFLIFINLSKKKLPLKKFLFLISGYILPFFPLFIFDLRHNFLNSKAFYQFFFSDNLYIKKDTQVWWEVFNNFIQPLIFYKNTIFLTKLFYFLILLITIFLIKKEKDFYKVFFISFLFLWLIFPFFFMLYGQRPSEYYFVFLYPFVYLTIIKFFSLTNKNFFIVIFFLMFLIFEIKKIKTFLKDNPYGIYYKNKTAKQLKKLTDEKKFNLNFSTPLGLNYGFSYFLDWYKIKQSNNLNDPLIEINIPPRKEDIKINDQIGIKVPKELK